MARIKIEKVISDRGVEHSDLRHFDDVHEAAKWLIENSYFMNRNVIEVIWTRVGDCEHIWRPVDASQDDVQFSCAYCGKDLALDHETLTKAAKGAV